jgi:dihydrofolate synthase/folylpolyglutamate synthase
MSNQSKKHPVHNRFNGASSDPIVEDRLAAVLQSLYGLHSKEIDLGLNRAYRFLERVGNPHLRLPRTVHVAGTNGKGSTIATLRALLEASGHTVHTYTSPHLVHPTERIVLAGSPITSEALLDLLTECIEINNGKPITFFELFTCAALLAYVRTPADYLLLEVGMGGRLDTTNVISNPVATIITAISMDHTNFLGSSIIEIAAEKAGIMKAGVPCIVGYQFPEAVEAGVLDVLRQKATDLSPNAPLLIHGAGWCTASESNLMLFRYEDDSIRLPKPRLSGNHQLWNAGAALAAFRVIAPGHFTAEILSTAMRNIYWPGRLQTLENHRYNEVLPDNWEVVIDGGHNDTGGLILADKMQDWTSEDDALPIHLIVAMVDRKDPRAFLRPLLPYAASITVTEIENEPTSYKAHALADIARELGFGNVQESPNVEEAVRLVATKADSKARVLITGSLFLMGNVLTNKPDINL